MADEIILDAPKVEEQAGSGIFNMDNWKSEPSAAVIPQAEEVIEKKVEEVIETKIEEKKVEEAIEEKNIEVKKEFANEVSEKVYNLLLEGKESEVLSYLNEQNKLGAADKLSPADAIKLQLEYANKDKGYTSEEINDLFNEKYEMPEAPEQEDDELDSEFEKRENKYKEKVTKIEARIARDAKPAIAELQKLKQEIVLPYTPKEQKETIKELTQEELDAQKVVAEAFLESANKKISKLEGYNTTYKDEEVEVNVGIKLTDVQKKELLPLVALSQTDPGELFKAIGWIDSKGEMNQEKFIADLPFLLYRDTLLKDMAENASSKRLAESKKQIKNIDFSGKQSSGEIITMTPQQSESKMASALFGG